MSSATVRAALQAYFVAHPIANLNKIYKAPPYWADGGNWQIETNSTDAAAAVAAIHLIDENESRLTLPAPSVSFPGAAVGNKGVHYRAGLMIFYQWMLPSNTQVTVETDQWTESFDAIIDGVKQILRNDPNLGNPSVIFEAGQDPSDLKTIRDFPRVYESGVLVCWASIEFAVTEIITD